MIRTCGRPLFTFLLVALAGCGGDGSPTDTPNPDGVHSVSIIQGGGQEATVGTSVTVGPAVRVTDEFGNGVPGVTVEFVVTSGDGTVVDGTQTTDSDGAATVGAWVLGGVAGANTLEARIKGLTATSFTATGVPNWAAMLLGTWWSDDPIRWVTYDFVNVAKLRITFSQTNERANLDGGWVWGFDLGGGIGRGSTLIGRFLDLSLIDFDTLSRFRFVGTIQDDGSIVGQLIELDAVMRKSN